VNRLASPFVTTPHIQSWRSAFGCGIGTPPDELAKPPGRTGHWARPCRWRFVHRLVAKCRRDLARQPGPGTGLDLLSPLTTPLVVAAVGVWRRATMGGLAELAGRRRGATAFLSVCVVCPPWPGLATRWLNGRGLAVPGHPPVETNHSVNLRLLITTRNAAVSSRGGAPLTGFPGRSTLALALTLSCWVSSTVALLARASGIRQSAVGPSLMFGLGMTTTNGYGAGARLAVAGYHPASCCRLSSYNLGQHLWRAPVGAGPRGRRT